MHTHIYVQAQPFERGGACGAAGQLAALRLFKQVVGGEVIALFASAILYYCSKFFTNFTDCCLPSESLAVCPAAFASVLNLALTDELGLGHNESIYFVGI
jgi:hypothetical protein